MLYLVVVLRIVLSNAHFIEVGQDVVTRKVNSCDVGRICCGAHRISGPQIARPEYPILKACFRSWQPLSGGR